MSHETQAPKADPGPLEAVVRRLRLMDADHAPDGYPAVQMRDISALCEYVESLEEAISRLLVTHCDRCRTLRAEAFRTVFCV